MNDSWFPNGAGSASRARRCGFVLVAFSLALLMILGTVGLAFDIGRMYVTRSELQSFCDAAALAAALQLDGTSGLTGGIARARAAALAINKGYQFGTARINATNTNITISFAQAGGVNWIENPNPAGGYILAKVVASARLPMWIIPVVTRQYGATIAASAIAKQIPSSGYGMNKFFPFAPYFSPPGYTWLTPPVPGQNKNDPGTEGVYLTQAYDDVPAGQTGAVKDPFGMIPARYGTAALSSEWNDENFQYQQGGVYTLRSPSSLQGNGGNKTLCTNDNTDPMKDIRDLTDNPLRGYVEYTNSAATIGDAITGSSPAPNGMSLDVGDYVTDSSDSPTSTGCEFCLVPGVKETEKINAITGLVNSDNNKTATSFKDYVNSGTGSGQRVVVMPIVAGTCTYGAETTDPMRCPDFPSQPETPLSGTEAHPFQVIGFAGFFLLPANQYDKGGINPICAEYIGPWGPSGHGGGGSGTVGPYTVKLVQ